MMSKLTTLTTCLFVMFMGTGVGASGPSALEVEGEKPLMKKAVFAINVEGYDSPKYSFLKKKRGPMGKRGKKRISIEKSSEDDPESQTGGYIELVGKWAKRNLKDSREARLFEMLVNPDEYFEAYMADVRALLLLENVWAGGEAPVIDLDAVMLGDKTLKSHSFLLAYDMDEALLKKLHAKADEFWKWEVLGYKMEKGKGLYGIQFVNLKPKGTPAKTNFIYISAKMERGISSYEVKIAPVPHYIIGVEQKSQKAKVVSVDQYQTEDDTESDTQDLSPRLNDKIDDLRNSFYQTLGEVGFGEPDVELGVLTFRL